MRILFLGDIVGKSGRKVITENIPMLRQQWQLDFVIANGENAAGGFGITPKFCQEFYKAGVDVITTGNHIWDQKEILPSLQQDERLLRPLNYPAHTPGKGIGIYNSSKGKIAVLNVMGRLFMEPNDDPFAALEKALEKIFLGSTVQAIIVDVHAEATSEKQGLGIYLDGRVSFVVGTHTHVPTADARILPNGTAYQTDAGMCGDYDSIIGMKKEIALPRLRKIVPSQRHEAAEGVGSLCGTIIETNPVTGLATSITPIRLGGRLAEQRTF